MYNFFNHFIRSLEIPQVASIGRHGYYKSLFFTAWLTNLSEPEVKSEDREKDLLEKNERNRLESALSLQIYNHIIRRAAKEDEKESDYTEQYERWKCEKRLLEENHSLSTDVTAPPKKKPAKDIHKLRKQVETYRIFNQRENTIFCQSLQGKMQLMRQKIEKSEPNHSNRFTKR